MNVLVNDASSFNGFGNSKEIVDVIVTQLEATYAACSIWEIDGKVND